MHQQILVDDFMSAEAYNKLPNIDHMRDAHESHADALQALLGLIRHHGLKDHFSVHLLHKHFDAPDGSIMVYETKVSPEHPTFMVFGPRSTQAVHNVRGLYYQAQPGGKMCAYEYTQDAGEDVSAYSDFVGKFSDLCFALGVQNVFALTVRRPMEMTFNEIEWPDLGATVLYPDSMELPTLSGSLTTVTDWSPPSDGSIPGIIELKCTTTRSGSHYNVTSSTRSGTHYEQRKVDGGSSKSPYEFDGKEVIPGTDMFKVFDAAYKSLTVC